MTGVGRQPQAMLQHLT